MRFGLRTNLKNRWTPIGIRPKGSIKIGYQWSYLYAAINPKEGLLQAWFMPDMQQNTFQCFLDDFSKKAKADSLLILDGAPSHRSRLKLAENIDLMLLPAYSPELNPVERLFQELRKALSNQIFNTIKEVEELLVTALQPYFQDQQKLIQLTLYPWMRGDSSG